MLNKDEYNQEEYNDYYRQETEGAEAQNQDEESGLISKLVILLIFLALAIAGYFGYKAIDKSTVDSIDTSLQVSAESSLPQSIQKEPTPEKKEPITKKEKTSEVKEVVVVKTKEIAEVPKKIEPKKIEPVKVLKTETVNNAQSAVTSEVTKAVSAQGKMSPEEIAAVVAAVMQQMNQEKSTDTSTDSVATKEDSLLIDELSDSEVDSISADLIKELENINISENTKVDNDKKQIDIYNKVNVQDDSGSDALSQLSNQINLVMAESVNKDKAENYTKSLKSEVSVRTNEMRIIVVKKGDTLGRISKRAYGNAMEYKKIYKANPEVTRPDRIYIGQKLRIPN